MFNLASNDKTDMKEKYKENMYLFEPNSCSESKQATFLPFKVSIKDTIQQEYSKWLVCW